MSQPFFSIILPTYNRASFIGSAIESVLNQTFDDFELIIIDDGSTDKTEQIVTSFNDKRILYFKKINEERNIARNFGIECAKGEYVCFLDSDDKYKEHHLLEAKNLANENPSYNWFYIGVLPSNVINDYNGENIRLSLIKENFFSINGIILKRSICSKNSFLNSKNAIVGEDHYLWLKLAAKYPIKCRELTSTEFVQHDQRSLHNIDLQKLIIGTEEIIENLMSDSIFCSYYQHHYRFFFAFKLCFIALVANENFQYNLAWNSLKKAIKMSWRIVFNKRFLAAYKNASIGTLKQMRSERSK